MAVVRVLGAGPAGGAAALTAIAQGAAVEIYEKSRFPRHKVCGEFLSPEARPLLERLGVWPQVARQAAVIRSMELWVGGRPLRARLDQPAHGISRFALDAILAEAAQQRGARWIRDTGEAGGETTVVATGRAAHLPKGRRLFGFKAHFTGPMNDCVELHFLSGRAYVGISAVEEGRTNVCGLAGEDTLHEVGFDIDRFLAASPRLAARLAPLRRCWDWMMVGPLAFGNRLAGPEPPARIYICGDALSFVDPFTGSGILSALAGGVLAGWAAAGQWDGGEYRARCRALLGRASAVSSLFRRSLEEGWGQWLAPWIPPRLLLQLTRPRLGALPGAIA